MKTMKRFAVVSLSVFALSFSVYPDCKAVPTFECIGIYYDKSGGGAECQLSYKRAADAEWKTGHPLSWDARDAQYRGSLVNLTPGTVYDIQLKIGATVEATLQCTTWGETFPIGQTITVSNQSATLNVTQSGTPQGYTLYAPGPGQQAVIDLNNAQMYGVNINADYVIIRGLKITGAKAHGILINTWKHDIVIENCEITNWGQAGLGAGPGGVEYFDWEEASGIRTYGQNYRLIIQNNTIHTPRGGSTYWGQTPPKNHPWGPQPFGIYESEGNNVIRYNYCYSESAHYFNDGIGGGSNSGVGPLNKDSDVYGNHVTHCWDDNLELEGALINCRIWENVLRKGYCGISIAIGSQGGPCYFWRNIIGDEWKTYTVASGDGASFKVGGPYNAVYVYHNTIVDKFLYQGKSIRSAIVGIGGSGNAAVNFTVKNNILHASRPFESYVSGETSNFADYNCYMTNPSGLPSSWEQHKVIGQPQYDTTRGFFQFFLKESHPAIDKGCVIPNFNDNSFGAGPDIGAFERGGDTLKFGPQGGVITGIIGERGFIKLLPYSINCWPNPFLNTAKISLGVMGEKNRQIEIYSLSGQLLRTISVDKQAAMWDGLDSRGMPVAAGQYLAQFRTNNQSLRQMVVKLQ